MRDAQCSGSLALVQSVGFTTWPTCCKMVDSPHELFMTSTIFVPRIFPCGRVRVTVQCQLYFMFHFNHFFEAGARSIQPSVKSCCVAVELPCLRCCGLLQANGLMGDVLR